MDLNRPTGTPVKNDDNWGEERRTVEDVEQTFMVNERVGSRLACFVAAASDRVGDWPSGFGYWFHWLCRELKEEDYELELIVRSPGDWLTDYKESRGNGSQTRYFGLWWKPLSSLVRPRKQKAKKL